jgi:hypothetical protein
LPLNQLNEAMACERNEEQEYIEVPRQTKIGSGPEKSANGWIVFVTGVHEETQEEGTNNDQRNGTFALLLVKSQ